MTTATIAAPAPKKARKRTTRRSDDPVTAYARAVVDGQIVSGHSAVLACQRHLRELTRQNAHDFPYVFDVAGAQHVIDFFPEFLTVEDGRPFELVKWLQFCLGSLFGWKRRDGGRRFRYAYIETAKGSGKTPTLAGVGLYCLAFDNEAAAEIYSAAFDKNQASLILNDAIRMANASEELLEILTVGKYNIAHEGSGSFFRAVSSEPRSKSGPRPHVVLIDELHEHREATIVNKMTAGFKFRWQPMAIAITNAGADRTSVCWAQHEKSLRVLDDLEPDDEWFAFICHLDACAVCASEGYRQPKDGCANCDNWTDPSVWHKANPALGEILFADYLKRQVVQAQTMPTDQALIKRLNFSIWTQTHQVWISAEEWDACRVESVSSSNPDGRPCAAGLDLADKNDLAALTVAIRFDDPPTDTEPEVVRIEGKDDEGNEKEFLFTLNFSIELIPFAWLPEQTLRQRVTSERIPYDVWARDGKIYPTPGAVIDHQAIYDFIAKDAWERFKIQRLGYDERSATMLAVNLRDKARLGDKIIAVPQGKKLSEACKLISQVLVPSRRLRHDGHPVQAWCFGNAEPQEDRLRAVWIEKPKDGHRRIDLAQSAIMAIRELMLLPSKTAGPDIVVYGGVRRR